MEEGGDGVQSCTIFLIGRIILSTIVSSIDH